MPDTLLRHWEMLRHLPRHPRKVAVAELVARLGDAGFAVTRRSIERDLVKLSVLFPIACDDQHKPHGWSWGAHAAAFDLPAMDIHAALAFRMAAEHLRPVLPEATYRHFEPHFRRAEAALDGLEQNALANWPAKVHVLPPGPPRLAPVVHEAVLEAVQGALIGDKQLRIQYRKPAASQARAYDVHPRALLWRGAIGYLVCTVSAHEDIVQFALHRMESAEVLDLPVRELPGFSVAGYLAEQGPDFHVGSADTHLDALLDPLAAVGLREAPLSLDQHMDDWPDGRVRLQATVADTLQLRAWLRSLGPDVEVRGPAKLREAMATAARKVAANYEKLP